MIITIKTNINMKKYYLMAAIAIMSATNVRAQLSDETQGVGGLVLDSIYTTDSKEVRSMKYVYEYTEAKLPKVMWSLAYFDDNNSPIDEPRTVGRDTYTYDEQNRQQKRESYKESNGELRLSYIEEIAEYDAETGLPALVYAYSVDQDDPDAKPQLVQKAVTKKYHGSAGMEEVEVYQMQDGEWTLMGSIHYDYDEDGHLTRDVMSVAGLELVTDYEYDTHGHMTRKVVKQQTEIVGVMYEISSIEMTFANDYYDDGNLKTSAEYDDGAFIETSHYFWGDGVSTAIRQMESALETTNQFFDLNGMVKNGKPSRKGLYIYKGKKVMIK